jgi:hypothetical protein
MFRLPREPLELPHQPPGQGRPTYGLPQVLFLVAELAFGVPDGLSGRLPQ